MHTVLIGILMGWGAAIPIGPVNLEIVRRNLNHGFSDGMAFGCGACIADLVYLITLSLSALVVLEHPTALGVVGILGSMVMAWFAYLALSQSKIEGKPRKHGAFSLLDGFLMTLLNPYTILFWASISSQVSVHVKNQDASMFYAGIGLLIGVFSWVLVLNLILHQTKSRLSDRFSLRLSKLGGIILSVFAIAGFTKSIMLLTQS